MSIEKKLANAREVNIFSELSIGEKLEADLLADIAVQIHTRRTEMGMSQGEFAKFNNVTQAMVSKWESGDYNFTIQTLAKVFAKIGLSCTFDIGDKRPAHAVRTEYVVERIQNWQTQTTSSSNWDRKTVSRAIYMTNLP